MNTYTLTILLLVFVILHVEGQSGYDSTCTCDSLSGSGSVCMKYTCSTTTRTASCFAGASRVYLENGQTRALADVRIGDRVLVNQNNKYEPVSSFIHAKQQGLFEFLSIEVKSTRSNRTSTLYVSANHLIFDYDSGEARFAGKFHVGDRLQFIDNDEIIPGLISKIQLTKKQGYYAPLTPSGTVVIDDIVASNYATVSNHALAHRVMGIYRWWIEITGGSKSNEDIPLMLRVLMMIEQMMRSCGGQMFINNYVYDGKIEISLLS